MRFSLIIAAFLLVSQLYCQGLFIPNQSVLYVGESAILSVDTDATLSGELVNEGLLGTSGNFDLGDNFQLGNVIFYGDADQEITGGKLEVEHLEIDKSNRVTILSDELNVKEELTLINGILSVQKSSLFIESGNFTSAGSQSFVEGAMSVAIAQTGRYTFPVGHEGSYQGISFEVQASDTVKVEVVRPESEEMIPGDSLIGLSDEKAWLINHKGKGKIESTLEADYTNLDLVQFPVENPIRANKYVPVISRRLTEGTFRSLGQGPGSMDEVLSSGQLTSLDKVVLKDTSLFLAIGVMPVSDQLHFYVPTVFAPNGFQQENKSFRPFLIGAEIEKVELIVWDKFNHEVFAQSVTNPNMEEVGWRGNNKNDSGAPQGVYFYSTVLTTSEGVFKKAGTVFLAR
ncbi:MAG: hypothetical protein ABJN36_12495 [Cyclobacteriaceae bacterium]